VRDEIGPSEETYANIDFSYTIQTSDIGKLAFGLKAGANVLNIDFTKLNISDPGDVFENNVDHKVNLQLGAGLYYYTDKFYAVLSVPNFIEDKHVDEASIENADVSAITKERLHYFFITGYVFDLSDNVKFRSAVVINLVIGLSLRIDGSANFLFYHNLAIGAAYRWSAAWSPMVGFQITDYLMLG